MIQGKLEVKTLDIINIAFFPNKSGTGRVVMHYSLSTRVSTKSFSVIETFFEVKMDGTVSQRCVSKLKIEVRICILAIY